MGWKVISFDFDNTIGRIDPPVHATIGTILEKHGVHVRAEEIHKILVQLRPSRHPLMEGRGWGILSDEEKNAVLTHRNRLLLKRLGIKSNLDSLAAAINDEWFAVRRLYPDVPGTFEQLRKMDITIAILAGPSSTTVKEVLGKYNLLGHVACFATSDIVSPKLGPLRKQDGSAYKYLIEKMKVDPSETIHVGDNVELDGDVPKSLGITAVLINRNEREDLLEASRAGHTVISKMQELLDFLKRRS